MFHLLFLVLSIFIAVGFAGKIHFPRTPFLTLCRAFISHGLRPYLSTCGGQLTARFAGCGRGPSLRCVHLRRTCSSLPASAAAEPCSPFTSAARCIPRFFARRQCRFVSHTRYYTQSRLRYDIFIGTYISINLLVVINNTESIIEFRNNSSGR